MAYISDLNLGKTCPFNGIQSNISLSVFWEKQEIGREIWSLTLRNLCPKMVLQIKGQQGVWLGSYSESSWWSRKWPKEGKLQFRKREDKRAVTGNRMDRTATKMEETGKTIGDDMHSPGQQN